MSGTSQIGLVSEILLAEAAAASSASLPSGAETLAVLELGDSDDSKAFIRAMARRGVYNVTPPRRKSFTRLPTPLSEATTFWKTKPKDWWIEGFVGQDPNWVYLSGHYTGDLFNQSSYKGWSGAFDLDFVSPSSTNNVLWSHYEADTGNNYRLNDRCHTVLIVGCNAITEDVVDATRNIQRMLSTTTRTPVVLGFADFCPTRGTETLVRHFVDGLAREWSRRAEADHILDSWLFAAETWTGPGRRLGCLNAAGEAFRVRPGAQDPWEWTPLTSP